MKPRIRFGAFIRAMLVILLLLACLVLVTAPARAATFQPNYWDNVLTNGVATVTNSQELAVTTKPFTLRQGKGIAVMPTLVATNTTSANVALRFEVTADGTNWSTTGALWLTNALSSTTPVRGYHVVPPDTLDNVRQIKLVKVINGHTNSINVTNVVISVSNQ